MSHLNKARNVACNSAPVDRTTRDGKGVMLSEFLVKCQRRVAPLCPTPRLYASMFAGGETLTLD